MSELFRPVDPPIFEPAPPFLRPDPYLSKRMCASCADALKRGESVVCGCYIPERDSPC